MKRLYFFIFMLFLFFPLSSSCVCAEDKPGPGRTIPRLEKTAEDPELFDNFVYPMWGPTCQRYTYTVTYRDKKGRAPEYVQIYFNGEMIDMTKVDPNDNNYQQGVRYEYKHVPNKIGSNFYYFEASNGVGKARASIIDSPDNGPVLFDTDFLDNEIAVVDTKTGKKVISFPTGKEWVGGVAMSDDGRYTAAKTSFHIYLFDKESPLAPIWKYRHTVGDQIGGDLKGGVDISGDGSRIIASIANSILFFNNKSNEPVWRHNIEGNAYNVAISRDGNYAAAATGGSESNVNSNLLIFWRTDKQKPLWQYHASGNFHDASLSDNGEFIAAATGCPDRRYYLFSKNSDTPFIKSEMLTRDSPVHRAKISADGEFSAVGSESGDGAVFLFSRNSKQAEWKFPTIQNSSVRALNFTPDGNFIGASTFRGQAYIFSRDSNQPITSWSLNAALGGIDIADDGSFIVVGGTDKKIHILSQDKKATKEVPFPEYVEEIDISASGEYVAVGTGGSVYFFETIPEIEGKATVCTKIIEPESMDQIIKGEQAGLEGKAKASLCGDGTCEGPETKDNCRQDCDQNYRDKKESSRLIKMPGMLSGFGFIGTSLLLAGYLVIVKFNLLKKQAGIFSVFNKRIIISLLTMSGIFLVLTVASAVYNKKQLSNNKDMPINNQTQEIKQEIKGRQPMPNDQKQPVCGNAVCEPDFGESKSSCPQDCSAN